VKFWQFLRFTAPGEFLTLATEIEKTPVFGVMLGDHSIFPEKIESHYPYSPDGQLLWDAQTPWPDVYTSIAAMAAVTTRLHFSTDVVVLPLRHPVEVARTAATLSHLSRGRYSLGTGVGWMREEFDILGVDFTTRGSRYDEMFDVIDLLWSGEMVEYHGEHFELPRSTLSPQPYGKIPIYMAGGSTAAMRRAARRADGWITGNFTTESIGPTLARMRTYLEDAGRDASQFEIIASCHADIDLYRRLEDLGVTSIVDLASRSKIGPRASIEQKIDYVHYFADTFVTAMQP
jgi:probable F420-dependent oxidoreductase